MKFDIIFAGLNRTKQALKNVQNINRETKEVNMRMRAAEQIYKNNGRSLKKLDDNTKDLIRRKNMLQDTTQQYGDRLKDATGTRPIFNLIDGFKKMSATMGGGIKGLLIGVKALAVGFFKIAIPILAIVGIFKLLKLAWDANIGGIQTKAMKVWGQIRTTFAQVQVAIVKGMRALEPVFAAVFKPLINMVKYIWALIKGLGTVLSAVLKPIFEVFKEIGKALEPLFSKGKKDGDTFGKVLKGIGKSAEILGKTLGFIVKVALIPLRIQIKIIGAVIRGLSMLFQKFKGSEAFERLAAIGDRVKSIFISLKNVFTSVKDVFSNVISSIWTKIKEFIDKLPGPIKSLMGFKGVTMDVSPAKEANKSNQNTVNNNQQINVNTSREIRGDSAAPFSKMLAQQMQTPY